MTVVLENKHLVGASLLPNRFELLRRLPSNAIVAEIGVAEGKFSQQIFKLTSPDKLHLIDLWDPNYDFPYLPDIRDGDHCFEVASSKFKQEITSGNVIFTRNDSLKAVNDFPDNYFDWIYIDTTHSYQRTFNELSAYMPKIKTNGILAGHDHTPGNINRGIEFGVIEAAKEFCYKNDFRYKYLTMDKFPSYALERIS